MHDRRGITRLLTLLIVVAVSTHTTRARADEFTGVEHKRQTIYHSPQKPGFTSWVGAGIMPDGSLTGHPGPDRVSSGRS